MISTLDLKWTDRVLTGSQTPRRFLDFVVDGEPLYPKMGEFISPLGWLGEQENQQAVNRLLHKAEPNAPNRRTTIYVCPECADLGCGAVTAVIERIDENILWRAFGIQNNYDDRVWKVDLEDVGPFLFNATDYYNSIIKALDNTK